MLLYFTLIAYLIATVAASRRDPWLLQIDTITIDQPSTIHYFGCDESPCTLSFRSRSDPDPSHATVLNTNASGNSTTVLIKGVLSGYYVFMLERNDDGMKSPDMELLLLPRTVHSGLDDGSQMETKTLIGIIVGISVACFLTGSGTLWWWIRRKQRKARTAPVEEEKDIDVPSTPTTPITPITPFTPVTQNTSRNSERHSLASIDLPNEPAPPYSRFPSESS